MSSMNLWDGPSIPIESEAGLRQALRGLPLEEPPAGDVLWLKLAPQLAAARRRNRFAPLWAIAAAFALAAIGLSLWRSVPPSASDTLAALKAESQQLEARLSQQRDSGSRWSLRTAELEQSLSDGLALTDLKLEAARDDNESISLWRRRVALLSTWLDLGAIGAEVADTDPRAAAGADVNPQTPAAAEEEPWL
jgi:hypothetical protein